MRRMEQRKSEQAPLLTVTGDRHLPLMAALLALEPETLAGMIEVIPYEDAELSITDNRVLRPPYLWALNEISQLLQNNGYEEASKFLDCSYEL